MMTNPSGTMPMNMLYRTLFRVMPMLAAVLAAALSCTSPAQADSVAQVQTTKYFAPETVQLLVDRAAAGNPGLQVGDTVNYIIQFSPVANGVDTGVAGYITDYIPPGTEVIGASIVNKDGAGNFYTVSPGLPGGIDTGWGNRGQNTFLAPFDTAAYDTTGRCASGAGTPTTVTYTSSGNWTAPAGVTSATVEVWGGGGAGGGETTNAGAGVSYKGGGAAGGQYASSVVAVTPGGSYAYVVGAGGTGSTGNGTAGGDSTFNGTTVVAKGGAGGASYENGGAAGTGSAAGGTGTTIYAGGSGSNGGASATGGAGGGGAGSGGAGGDAAGNTAGTGTATSGGAGGAGRTTTGNGNAGAVYGGGGGGGYAINSTTNRNGGAGAGGQISITYTASYTNNCNGRLTELHADTGIFFSTDSRTAVFPVLPTRILQGTNGYNVNPTAAGQLNPIIGQAAATTHNLWDADQTNAFGSTQANINALAAPKSSQTALLVTKVGQGAVPYNAGSAVAGPQSGYQLDNTAQVGPWQRIAYQGSRIGDNTNGPATDAGSSLTAVGGSLTSVGWNLSAGNPLPAGTNAVRWAVGQLVVGEIRYVKISLRTTASVPTDGIVNSSEVFGGDAGGADDGKDNPWRYHVPSVADNNSNLYLLKSVVCVFSGGVCQSSQGSYIPANAKVRYRIVYMNSGNSTQTNVTLSDTLPCQTDVNPVSNINIVSGPIGLPSTNPPVAAKGDCTTNPDTRSTFSFPTVASLSPGASGSIELDVQTNAVLTDTVTNSAKLVSTQIPAGVVSHTNSYVLNAPNLLITKTTSTPSVLAGGTATYTITIQNTGTAATNTSLIVYDILPSAGGAANAATRFSYASTTSITGLTSVVPTTTGPPPTLTPYNSGGVSSNQQQVQWNFGTQTIAAGASATIVFDAAVGADVPASATPYYNSAVVTYGGGPGRFDAYSTAGVTVTSPLSVTKTVESYYNTATATWVTYSNNIPASAKVRYRIDYANTGGSAINNVILTDTLPCQTAAAPVSYNGVANTVSIVSGPITAPSSATLAAIAAGSCPGTRRSFSFPTLANLAAGQTGQIKFDVQTNAANGNIVTNTATLSGTGVTSSISEVQASVLSAPLLLITKTASVTAVAQGGSLSYTISATNTGTADATGIVLYDWLPTTGGAVDPNTRFSYVSTTSITGLTSVTPTAVIASDNLTGTVAVTNGSTTVTGTGTSFTTALAVNDLLYIAGVGYKVSSITSNTVLVLAATYKGVTASGLTVTKTPSPYNTSSNQQQVTWNFGTQTLAPGASFSVIFQSQVGASVPNSPPSYSNFARVNFTGGQADSGAASVNVGQVVNHYELSLPTSSISCLPTTATVTACADSSSPCTNNYTAASGTTATLATNGGTLGATTVTFNASGVASTTLSYPAAADGATVSVTLSGEQTAASSSRKCCPDGASCVVANACSTTFNTAGLIFSNALDGAVWTIPTQVAGASDGNTYYLRAVKTNTTTKACESALAGANTVNFAYECNNPTTCSGSNLMSVNGGSATTIARNDNGSVSSYTPVGMTFDANGNAPFTFIYSDVGLVKLWVNNTVNSAALAGVSNAFVAKPYAFVLSGIQCTNAADCATGNTSSPNNPGAADETGLPFMKAGAAFTATVTATAVGGAATPNYGKETTPETVLLARNLVSPSVGAGGNNPTLANPTAFGSFTNGAATGTTFNWSEVGIITLTPSVGDANYLGVGDVSGTTSGNVGRFIPDHFDLIPSPVPGCSGGASFTYSGQPFTVMATARNLAGTTTLNYRGAAPVFARLTTFSDVTGATSCTNNTIAATGYTTGVGSNSTITCAFPAKETALQTITLRAVDTDSVSSAGHTEGTMEIRSGRIHIFNAYGSELVDLPVPMLVEYYSTDGWIANTNDTCSSVGLSALTNFQGNLSAGETCVQDTGNPGVSGQGCGALGPTGELYLALPKITGSPPPPLGSYNLYLKAPGVGNEGSVDVTANLLSKTWLRFDWDGNGTVDDPTGKATFGLYRGSPKHIYMRERY